MAAVVVTLKKAITVGDKSIDSLSLDFDKLTGADFEMAEREAMAEGGYVPLADVRLSPPFRAQLAERASGVSVDLLRGLPLLDYARVVQAVQDFLFGLA